MKSLNIKLVFNKFKNEYKYNNVDNNFIISTDFFFFNERENPYTPTPNDVLIILFLVAENILFKYKSVSIDI